MQFSHVTACHQQTRIPVKATRTAVVCCVPIWMADLGKPLLVEMSRCPLGCEYREIKKRVLSFCIVYNQPAYKQSQAIEQTNTKHKQVTLSLCSGRQARWQTQSQSQLQLVLCKSWTSLRSLCRSEQLSLDYCKGLRWYQVDNIDRNLSAEECLCILTKSQSYIVVIFQMFRVWFTHLPRQSGKTGLISGMRTKWRTYFNYIKSKRNLRDVFNQPQLF